MKTLCCLLFAAALSACANPKPSFLFILVDDLGINDLSVEGSTFYETPNVDRLARSGMRFDAGYAACSVCSPSRAAILTGKAPARLNITDWIGAKTGTDWNRNDRVLPSEYIHYLPPEEITIAEALRAAGYKTFFAGKWHLGTKGYWPEDNGFDINIGGWDSGSPKGAYFAPWINPNMPQGTPGESLTIRLAKETADFMEKNKDNPFFATLSFYAVHSPIQTTQELWEKYRAKAEAQNRVQGVTSRFIMDRTQPVRQVQDNPVYGGLIETMDDAVGIVLSKLRELGLEDNTVVIFTSDNGGVSSGDAYSTSLLPYRGGKGRQWEGGTRVPMYIRAPGVTVPGSSTDVPMIHMDLYPTILQLAGLPELPQQHIDGTGLLPLLEGNTLPPRDLFWHYPHYGNQGGEPSAYIRSGDWKLIHYFEDGRDELYNLNEDTGEVINPAAQQVKTAAELRSRLDAWLVKTEAKIPQPDPRFDAQKKDEQLQFMRTEKMEQLEKQAADYLKPNWQPDPTWWGSQPETTP
jgi:arylsulfatase A-like enzyme